MTNQELVRSNKVTAQFEGEGVMVGTFYRTHNKLGQVRSTDETVATAGFQPLETVAGENGEMVDATPAQKLEAFRTFLKDNAVQFGYVYDPVDRRPEGNKFPNKYNEELFIETASQVLTDALQGVIEKLQNQVDKMVENGHLEEGAQIECSLGLPAIDVVEKYKNGNLKYADVTIPTTFTVLGQSTTINAVISLVSGQLKKPRELGDYVFTMTGLKTALTDAGVLPVIEKPAKEDADAEDMTDAGEADA